MRSSKPSSWCPVPATGACSSWLAQMPGLRVVQTLSAGVDWLLPFVPAGVTLCDAGGTRDVPVAEWVLAAILASTKDAAERCAIDQREHRWRMA